MFFCLLVLRIVFSFVLVALLLGVALVLPHSSACSCRCRCWRWRLLLLLLLLRSATGAGCCCSGEVVCSRVRCFWLFLRRALLVAGCACVVCHCLALVAVVVGNVCFVAAVVPAVSVSADAVVEVLQFRHSCN